MKFYSKDGCIYCDGPHHISSEVCSRPACLAKYWRWYADQDQNRAGKYREMAEELEAEAAKEQEVK